MEPALDGSVETHHRRHEGAGWFGHERLPAQRPVGYFDTGFGGKSAGPGARCIDHERADDLVSGGYDTANTAASRLDSCGLDTFANNYPGGKARLPVGEHHGIVVNGGVRPDQRPDRHRASLE